VLHTALGILSLTAHVLAAPPARIDSSFPPLQERRAPDRTIAVEGGPPLLLAYSGDGRMVATTSKGAQGQVVRLYNARTGEEGTGEQLRELAAGSGPVAAIGFRANTHLVVVAVDRAITVFEVATGKPARSGRVPGEGPLAAAAVGAGAPLVAAIADGQLVLFDHESNKVVRQLPFPPANQAGKGCLAFRADGKALVASAGSELRLYDVQAGKLLRTVESGGPVGACALSEAHVVAAVAAGVKVWPLASEESPRLLAAPKAGLVTISAKGDQLASAAGRGFQVWDVQSGMSLSSYEGHSGAVAALAFNPNGQKLVSAGADKTVRLWTVPLPPLPAADLEKISEAVPNKATAAPRKKRKLLVFWRADAILHKGGVPAANKAIELMGRKTGAFQAFFSRDYEVFDPKILAHYDAIVFNSTAHITLPDEAKKRAFLDWVAAGHGVVGVHAAIDMWKRWPEGAAVVGATFGGHPWHPSGTWSVKLDDPGHPLLQAFRGKPFKMHDEFYELDEPYKRGDRRVLMSLDVTDPVTANVSPLHRKDRDFAVSWIKRHGEGRIFYCMFGHLADPFHDPAVQQYYLDGIQYALGDLPMDATPRP
jgi:type 1 glutamine amidotransferase